MKGNMKHSRILHTPRHKSAVFSSPAERGNDYFRSRNRIISGFAIILFAISQLNAQSFQDLDNAVLLSDNFDESQGRLTFYADNKDFCDYYLAIFFLYSEGFQGMASGTSVVVNHGQQQIRNYKVNEQATRYGYNYRYAMFRGNPNKKPNVEFAYSLPVADEETVFATTTENQEGYQLAFVLPVDTVYACRGGVICDDNLKDHTAKGYKSFSSSRGLSQITAYHADGTFGEYVFNGKSLVYPGDDIQMGTPIALIDNSLEKYSVRFSAYFLDKNKVKDKNIGNKHTHFRPFFQTHDEGKVRLENGKTYICELTDEMLMQDMSKGEQKKFLKNRAIETDEKK
jgi:hypothetical protein